LPEVRGKGGRKTFTEGRVLLKMCAPKGGRNPFSGGPCRKRADRTTRPTHRREKVRDHYIPLEAGQEFRALKGKRKEESVEERER